MLLKGEAFILIRNKTTSAKKLPYMFLGKQLYMLKEVFVTAIVNYCESIGKVHSRDDFTQVVIGNNTVLGKCVGKNAVHWQRYVDLCLNRTSSYKWPPCEKNHPESIFAVPPRFNGIPSVDELKMIASGDGPISGSDASTKKMPNKHELIQISSGTGFAITDDGHIVTNNHVIEGCSKVLLVDDGKYVPLKVLANDPMNDLAVLKGDFTPSETFAIGKGNPELMQDIYVSGYPFGKKVSTSVKVTRGIISSLTGYGNNFSGIQIDAAIQPGNSGGPIFDDYGNVVGVVVSKLAKQGDITPENTNFGVKANILANVLVSNSVPFIEGNVSDISKGKLSAKASDATFYLSCWNTVAEAQKMRTKKVMFGELD